MLCIAQQWLTRFFTARRAGEPEKGACEAKEEADIKVVALFFFLVWLESVFCTTVVLYN